MLLLFLPGLPFIYQGDELGLESILVKPEDQADPVALRNEDSSDGRDGARSPIPWHAGENLGFSTGKPWLPIGDRLEEETVDYQRSDQESTLFKYKELFEFRAERLDHSSPLKWITSRDSTVIAFTRADIFCAINVGDQSEKLNLGKEMSRIEFSVGDAIFSEGILELGEASAVILMSGA